ncbi:hypothetical protein AB0465_37700 [Streptomyces griseoviridis]|uniref:hypothetical protein n=1 Tax=Streptomyces griseoviridis TaxID=45398 RepID=UPI00344F45F6
MTDAQVELVARQLTHLVLHTCHTTLWRQSVSVYQQDYAPGRDLYFLTDGYASWAASQVTRTITEVQTPRGPDRPHPRYHQRARDAVTRIVEAHGVEVFNQVWEQPALYPTHQETETAEGGNAWIRCFHPGAQTAPSP